MPQRSVLTLCVAAIAIVIVFAALQQTKGLFAPIVAALVLGIVMTPLSDAWDRLRVPPALAALFSVMLALAAIIILGLLIEPYATQAINKAPVIWHELRDTVEDLKYVLRGIEEMKDDVAAAIEASPDSSSEDAVKLPTAMDALFYAPQFAGQVLIFVGTLYFFLMARNDIYVWVTHISRRFGESDLRYANKQVARYVLTISAINLGMGVVVAIAMQILGMPSPILWGIMAFSLNYLLYLGPIIMIATLTITGIVMFEGAQSFLPAIVYLLINGIEAQFATPTLVGRSLSVNPLLVFLSLVFWMWLWGPVGGVIAIPMLVWGIAIYERLMMVQTISAGTPGTANPNALAASTS